MIKFSRNILKEESNEESVNKYADFLEKDVPNMIQQKKFRNAEALITLNKEFADIVRANPSLMEESPSSKLGILTEMSKGETINLFKIYYDFMDHDVRAKLNKNEFKKIHDNLLDVVRNIRNYPEVLASAALALSNTALYQE